MTDPTETQVLQALAVIENCSSDELKMLTIEAMVQATRAGVCHEICIALRDGYGDEHTEWTANFDEHQ